jgi:organic hydroperoxide reductase OsmC/OhrA
VQEFPHHYQVAIDTRADAPTVTIASQGLPPLVTAPPVEFGGPGTHWSPETLLVAAVADCFTLGFKAIAAASRLDWSRLEVNVSGKLDRIERKMRFTELDIVAKVTVPAAAASRAPRILEKAEESCLITNSLSANVRFTGNVEQA